jgi:GNAT superfamily N-acetyltransferase
MAFARVAQPGDYPTITCFDEWRAVTPEVIASGRCTVAGRADQIEAYAITSYWFGAKPFVETVFVATAARRCGLGSALLSMIESTCGGKRLWITTGLQNLAMQQLLHARGYELCGVIANLAKIPELVYSRDPGRSGS